MLGVLLPVPVACALDVTVDRQELPQPPDGKPVSWLIHRGGWGDSPAYGSRLDARHYDGFAQDYPEGLGSEFVALSELSNAAFIQDFGNVRKLAATAHEHNASYAVVNTLSPLAMRQASIQTPEECSDYLIHQLSTREDFPGYYSIEGKPVVFMFDVGGFTPGEWETILARTREAYPGEDLQFIAQRSVFVVLRQPDPEAYLREILSVFDGIMFWGGPPAVKLKNLELARSAIESLGEDKLVFWVLTNGYWRPEKGMYMDPRGAATWLEQLKICFEQEFAGLVVESWNDFEENTAVAPSRENGGVFWELLKYYSAISNGKEYVLTGPGLLLLNPKEVLLGETIRADVLVLPVDGPRRSFQLELLDERGEQVYCSPEYDVPEGTAEVFTFEVPTRGLAACQRLEYRFRVDGHACAADAWTSIRAVRLDSPWVQGTVLADVFVPEEMDFSATTDADTVRVNVKVEHDTPLRSVEIYRGDALAWSLEAERLNDRREWTREPVGIELDFQMPKAGYPGEVNDRTGTLRVEGGYLVRGYNKLGRSVIVSSDKAVWSAPPGLGRQFNIKLLADADDMTRFIVDLPALKKTFAYSLAQIRERGLIEEKTTAHGRVWISLTENPVLFPGGQDLLGQSVRESVSFQETTGAGGDEYVLRLVDADGKIARAWASIPDSGDSGEKISQWLWDAKGGERFSRQAGCRDAAAMNWGFDGPPGRVYRDEHGGDVLVRLGGGMFRAGHFSADAVPGTGKQGEGRTLVFHGDDYAQIDANAFPLGAFTLEMDFLPKGGGEAEQTLFMCRSDLRLSLLDGGKIAVEVRGLEGLRNPLTVLSENAVMPGKWNAVKVSYDYERLRLCLNGRESSVALALGPRRGVSAESYLGAQVGGDEGTQARGFFIGEIDNLRLEPGAWDEE